MNIQPLSDYVIVRRLSEHQLGPGGIVIPEGAMEKPNQGEVTGVGPGKTLPSGERRPPEVSTGDMVLFENNGITEIKIGNEKLVVIHEDQIIGKLVG
jgi:chaperonin GroES